MKQIMTSDVVQRYIESIQDDRPCPQCDFSDFSVTDIAIGETVSLIDVTCGCCGWKQEGKVANRTMFEAAI